MDDYRKLCFLTENEVKKIGNWISENNYTLNPGYFDLVFGVSPYGIEAFLSYTQGENSFLLNIKEAKTCSDPLRTIDHIVIDGQDVQLNLSTEALESYFKVARSSTEAHLDADCEPTGSYLVFKICYDQCSLFADDELIETR